ncbi:MAG TPA: hypothetical protein DEH11_07505, partial [Actinobacteria bacterium]|nr:hypothetical protein [Actinomycetota bacterium]
MFAVSRSFAHRLPPIASAPARAQRSLPGAGRGQELRSLAGGREASTVVPGPAGRPPDCVRTAAGAAQGFKTARGGTSGPAEAWLGAVRLSGAGESMSAGSKAVIMMTSRGAARHSGTQRPAALRAKIGDKLVIDEPGGARQARIGEITA